MKLFPNDLPHLTQREMAKGVLEWLSAHPQLTKSGRDRLTTQCQLIMKSEGLIENNHPRWRDFVQSLEDVQEYRFMMRFLGEKLLQPPFLRRFSTSLSDTSHPADSKSRTPGRDAQFELFLAAIAARAGLEVQRPKDEGPDWIMVSPTGHWSLEAKRIKSEPKIKERIQKASGQIRKSQIGGVIAIDISLALNPCCSPLPRFMPDAEIQAGYETRMDAFTNGKLAEWIGSSPIGFVLLRNSVIRPAQGTRPEQKSWALIQLWRKLDMVYPDSSCRKHYDMLWELLRVALPDY